MMRAFMFLYSVQAYNSSPITHTLLLSIRTISFESSIIIRATRRSIIICSLFFVDSFFFVNEIFSNNWPLCDTFTLRTDIQATQRLEYINIKYFCIFLHAKTQCLQSIPLYFQVIILCIQYFCIQYVIKALPFIPN